MTTDEGSSHYGTGYWIALGVGGAVMAVATWGAYNNLSLASFVSWGKWVIGLDLVNDFFILPIVGLVGVGLSRLPLGRLLGPIQAGLFATGVVLLIAYPGLTEQSASDNPTIQPINYATATLTVLGVIWFIVAAWAGFRVRVARSPRAD